MSIEEPGSPREWLIRKGIYFYRPGKSGYTAVKSQAGRYTELDARREAEIEPWHMDAIHQDMVPDPAGDINVSEIASLKAALAASQEENLSLREALAEAEQKLSTFSTHVLTTLRDKTHSDIALEHEADAWRRDAEMWKAR
jgi:hypothetical protein